MQKWNAKVGKIFNVEILNSIIYLCSEIIVKIKKKQMRKILFFSVLIFSFQVIYAQNVRYSPKYFGPNANPVPEFTDATIPAKTTISLMGDYYFGFGDITQNGLFKIEVPLLSERVSIKVWTTLFEHYQVSDEVSVERNMLNGNTSGNAGGDFYIQTRMLIFKENKYVPSVILNSTLKSASGTNFLQRRYFDTPGYYFDTEIGKSFYTNSKFISEIRAVANLGFMCWETTNSTQDDAPMYGGKIIIGNEKWKFENTLSGYWGWMHTNINYGSDYGDAPIVYSTKFSILSGYMDYFAQYQYGIKDFPYHQIMIGVSFPIEKLTPKY